MKHHYHRVLNRSFNQFNQVIFLFQG